MVEENREAVKVIQQNLAICGFAAVVIRGTLPAALARVSGVHDLVFVDPPYRLSLASVHETLEHLDPYLADGATVVVHRRKGEGLAGAVGGLVVEDDRTYGDSQIVRLRKRGNP